MPHKTIQKITSFPKDLEKSVNEKMTLQVANEKTSRQQRVSPTQMPNVDV